jgi:methionine sulfoxide reductase heme-binding subunit
MTAQAVNGWLRRIPAWPIYIVCAAWTAWMFWLGLTGGLGPEPINALEREYGELAIKLVIVGLAVTPLRDLTGVSLIKFRRAIGVSAFGLVLAHFLVWAVLDLGQLSRIWADIVKRPYITVGMLAFAALIPLAATSNNLSVRRMGAAAWKRLHRLTYPAAALAALHYFWIAKGFEIEAILHVVVILGLLALRFWPIRVNRGARAG